MAYIALASFRTTTITTTTRRQQKQLQQSTVVKLIEPLLFDQGNICLQVIRCTTNWAPPWRSRSRKKWREDKKDDNDNGRGPWNKSSKAGSRHIGVTILSGAGSPSYVSCIWARRSGVFSIDNFCVAKYFKPMGLKVYTYVRYSYFLYIILWFLVNEVLDVQRSLISLIHSYF